MQVQALHKSKSFLTSSYQRTDDQIEACHAEPVYKLHVYGFKQTEIMINKRRELIEVFKDGEQIAYTRYTRGEMAQFCSLTVLEKAILRPELRLKSTLNKRIDTLYSFQTSKRLDDCSMRRLCRIQQSVIPADVLFHKTVKRGV